MAVFRTAFLLFDFRQLSFFPEKEYFRIKRAMIVNQTSNKSAGIFTFILFTNPAIII